MHDRHVTARLSHGGTVRGTPDNVALAASIDARMVGEERAAVTQLRAAGVKAAHPDDGWVNRDRNTVRLEYPAFNDHPQVGDLIALGWPWKGYRLVRVTHLEGMETTDPRTLAFYGMRPGEPWCYHFEPLVEPAPEPPPAASSVAWWRLTLDACVVLASVTLVLWSYGQPIGLLGVLLVLLVWLAQGHGPGWRSPS